jgi:flagellar biosynthesis protein FlhB
MKQTKEQFLKTRELNNKQIIAVIIGLVIFLMVGILIGIPMGMMIQQALFVEGFEQMTPTLEKINVNIGLNETFLVEETKRVAMAVLDIQQQTYGDPHNINIDATCPGRNTTKTVEECIREVESR